MFAWQELVDGEWRTITAGQGSSWRRPLISTERHHAVDMYGPLAEQHGRYHGRQVRLARFEVAELVRAPGDL